jgi:hypothetical protein
MSSESEIQSQKVHSITNILSGFTSAEASAEEVIDLVLEEGGKKLYEAYIAKKSFPFSSEIISSLLIAELKMCFVRHDEGEPRKEDDAEDRARLGDDVDRSIEASSTSPASLMLAQTASPDPIVVDDAPQVLPTDADAAALDVPEVAVITADADAAQAEDRSEVEGAAADEAAAPICLVENEAEVSCFSWELEAEPERCRIDTWARACVPVRRTVSRPKSKGGPDDGRLKKPGQLVPGRSKKNSTMSSRTNSRNESKMITSPAGSLIGKMILEDDKGKSRNDGMIPLVEEVEHDEEEAAMREMKEREAKRKREEDIRIQKKASEEAEEAARLAQQKDQMKNKPYTYDSNGKIIWVETLNAEKLPSANPIPSYVLRREQATTEHFSDRRGSLQKADRVVSKKLNKARGNKDPEFVDTFKKFSSQQPPMMESMKMAPGVQLRERGALKTGEDPTATARATHGGNAPMSRRDYEALVQSGSGYPGKEKEEVKEAAEGSPATIQAAPREAAAPAEAAAEQAAEPKQAEVPAPRASPKAKTVSPAGQGSGLVPHAPAMPRPEQPVPPPSMRRVQLKAAATGMYGLSSRERVPTGTGSRYPGCAAPPLLGATMGHGLLPLGSKHEEFYFPNSPTLPQIGVSDEDDAGASPKGSSAAGATPRVEGQIVNKNPELAKRLFHR